MKHERSSDGGFDDYAASRWPVLVRSAYLLGCSASDAEDVAQSVLLQAFRHWRRVSTAISPDAYVHRMLINESRRHLRRKPLGAAVDTGPSRPSDIDPDTRMDVRHALAQLPEDQRAVLVLRFFNDLSVTETAAAIGVAAGTVKSRTSRGLDLLRAMELGKADSST